MYQFRKIRSDLLWHHLWNQFILQKEYFYCFQTTEEKGNNAMAPTYSRVSNCRTGSNKSVQACYFGLLLHKNARFWLFLANFCPKLNSRTCTAIRYWRVIYNIQLWKFGDHDAKWKRERFWKFINDVLNKRVISCKKLARWTSFAFICIVFWWMQLLSFVHHQMRP